MTPLQDAAQDLQNSLDHHGIKISGGGFTILNGNTATSIDPMTSKKECLKILKRMIKAAKEAEFQRTQGRLL